jgi:hypothetical protein
MPTAQTKSNYAITLLDSILKMLADVGEACAAYQDRVMSGLRCTALSATKSGPS